VPNRHHPHRLAQPEKISSENKSQNSGVSFRRKKRTIKTPRFTSNSPQIHHKKPHQKHHISSKPPARTPSHHAKKKTARQKAEPHFKG
jgi:hypothetical protein